MLRRLLTLMLKKILFIIVILSLSGLGAWYFFARSSSAPTQDQSLTNILPFGSGEGSVSDTGSETNNGFGTTTSSSTVKPHLFKISDAPIAGATAFTNKAGVLTVRYAERATGHIYDVDPVSLAKTEIVNTTVPKIYQAVFKDDGTAVIFRTLRADGETIDTNSLALIPPTGTSTTDLYTTKTTGLPANVSEIAAGHNTIFYNVKNLPQIVSALFDGTKAATIWSAAFTQWQLRAAGDTSLVLTTKPSASADGYSYSLSAKTGALAKLVGPLQGLMAVPNSTLSKLLFSYIQNGSIVLSAKNLSSGKVTSLMPVTLADKCVWSIQESVNGTVYCGVPTSGPASDEPDAWYQGRSHYSDRIFRYDTESQFYNVIADPKKRFQSQYRCRESLSLAE